MSTLSKVRLPAESCAKSATLIYRASSGVTLGGPKTKTPGRNFAFTANNEVLGPLPTRFSETYQFGPLLQNL